MNACRFGLADTDSEASIRYLQHYRYILTDIEDLRCMHGNNFTLYINFVHVL